MNGSELSLPVLILVRICHEQKIFPRPGDISYRASNRYVESAYNDSGIMIMFSHMTSEHGVVDAIVSGELVAIVDPSTLPGGR